MPYSSKLNFATSNSDVTLKDKLIDKSLSFQNVFKYKIEQMNSYHVL